MKEQFMKKDEILSMLESINNQLDQLEFILTKSVAEHKKEILSVQSEKIEHIEGKLISLDAKRISSLSERSTMTKNSGKNSPLKLELGY